MASRRFDSVRRRRLTPQQRQRLLARYHKGRFSQSEFAARHSLGASTLSRWLQEERKQGQPAVSFQEVVLPRPTGHWVVEVVSAQGWTIRLAQGGDPRSLSQLLGALPC